MARKKATQREPYWLNPHIKTMHELPFGRDIIKPGDNIRIKNQRGTYKVYQFAYNDQTAVTWVDCMHNDHGSFHSFYVTRIKRVDRAKRSIRKKLGQIVN